MVVHCSPEEMICQERGRPCSAPPPCGRRKRPPPAIGQQNGAGSNGGGRGNSALRLGNCLCVGNRVGMFQRSARRIGPHPRQSLCPLRGQCERPARGRRVLGSRVRPGRAGDGNPSRRTSPSLRRFGGLRRALVEEFRRNDILIADRVVHVEGGEIPLDAPPDIDAWLAEPGVRRGRC